MKLIFLGTKAEGSGRKSHKKSLALFLETNGKSLLLDFGTDWKEKLELFSPDYIWLSSPERGEGLGEKELEVPLWCLKGTLTSAKCLPPLGLPRQVEGSFFMESLSAQAVPIESSKNNNRHRLVSGLVLSTDIGEVGYFPDVRSSSDLEKLQNAQIFIGSGNYFLRDKEDKPSIKTQLAWLKKLGVKQAIFTNLGPELLAAKEKELRTQVYNLGVEVGIEARVAYDGLMLEFKMAKITQEESLSNYLGSKRRFTDKIMKCIPQGTKTLFDPMCGAGHVLIAAAKQGTRVIGNDLSPIAYLYLKGIFQGEKLAENAFDSAQGINGWLSRSGLKRPLQKESKQLIDGVIHHAWKDFSGGQKNTALSVCSLLLQTYFHSFAAFIQQHEPYSREQILGDLRTKVKDINALIEQAGGKGKIFCRNILKEEIPHSEVIYFDPPYFPVGLENKEYFRHYRIPNSVLMQKDWSLPDPHKEDIVHFLSKLTAKTNHLIISTSSPSEIAWKRELIRLNSKVKIFYLAKVSTGAQPQGERANPVEARVVKELLIVAENSRSLEDLQRERKEQLKTLSETITKGLHLSKFHAELIARGQKTGIVKNQKFDLGQFRVLYSIEKDNRGKAYGYIRCSDPKLINSTQLRELRDKHKISEKQAQKWWGIPIDVKLQTDKDLMLKIYNELKSKNLPEETMITEIAKHFLAIGGDLEYWKKKVRDVLEMEGKIKKQLSENPQQMKINAPTFAYMTCYQKPPPEPLFGRTESPKKNYKLPDGSVVSVDENIKDKWLNALNGIPEVEIRSTDEGKSDERVAFVIFRFKEKKDDSRADAVVNELRKFPETYAKTDIGMAGRPRICVAGKVIVNEPGWEKWWNGLACKIETAVKILLVKPDEEIDSADKAFLYKKLGFWRTSNGTVIGDEYADRVDKFIDLIQKDLEKAFPEITKKQIAATIKFCAGYLEAENNKREKAPAQLYYYTIQDFIPFPELRDITISPRLEPKIRKIKFIGGE